MRWLLGWCAAATLLRAQLATQLSLLQHSWLHRRVQRQPDFISLAGSWEGKVLDYVKRFDDDLKPCLFESSTGIEDCIEQRAGGAITEGRAAAAAASSSASRTGG